MRTLKYIFSIIISFIIILYLSIKISFNKQAFEVIATFLSITTGFTITSLSIIATSPFSKKLYDQENKKDNSKTLLHELVNKFKASMILFVITIGLIIFFNLFSNDYDKKSIELFQNSFILIDFLKTSILYFTILSFRSFILLFSTFSKFVIKSGQSIK
ncbi:hypothetical protein [Flavobacterium inviolabile]|uniref:hypothetical protein n=1 Tax=Flavobacterium inviolabile TaxID=2748320 RepID=UPI0015AB0A73|nr:hypothetical protein [Flavobacterium inviolabile]